MATNRYPVGTLVRVKFGIWDALTGNGIDPTTVHLRWMPGNSSTETTWTFGSVGNIVHDSIARTVTDGVLTSGSTTITSATAVFLSAEVGAPIGGIGLPVGTTIATWVSATTVTLSNAATATATGVSLTFGGLYHADLDTTGAPGLWNWGPDTSGTGQTAGDSSFEVMPSNLR